MNSHDTVGARRGRSRTAAAPVGLVRWSRSVSNFPETLMKMMSIAIFVLSILPLAACQIPLVSSRPAAIWAPVPTSVPSGR